MISNGHRRSLCLVATVLAGGCDVNGSGADAWQPVDGGFESPMMFRHAVWSFAPDDV
jgi:hypothetical protein